MKRIDEETYVGACRRTAARTGLLQRRRRDRAHPTPPPLERLLRQLSSAEPSARNRMRLQAAIDLASRLDDRPMQHTFRHLETAMRETPGDHVLRV